MSARSFSLLTLLLVLARSGVTRANLFQPPLQLHPCAAGAESQLWCVAIFNQPVRFVLKLVGVLLSASSFHWLESYCLLRPFIGGSLQWVLSLVGAYGGPD